MSEYCLFCEIFFFLMYMCPDLERNIVLCIMHILFSFFFKRFPSFFVCFLVFCYTQVRARVGATKVQSSTRSTT